MKYSARILDQISRTIPSSLTDERLYVDANKFQNPENNADVSVGINSGQYGYPEGAKYPARPLRA
eukprot:13965708-Alexandrium_andersonii.AAC.1